MVLYESETWSPTLRKKRAFKNKMLRKIIGPKWKELTGDWIQ
jgi:hypothetical protein